MALKISKWGKFSIVLALVALCCFVFAGAALSNSAVPFDHKGIIALDDKGDPQANPYTGMYMNVVKGSHTYDYGIYSGIFEPIEVGVFANQPIIVDFPEISGPSATQFDLAPAIDQTVSVRVYTSGSDPYTGTILQTIPEIDNVNHTATFVIQKQNLPQIGKVYSFQIEGLRVKNTCLDGDYCIKLSHPCLSGGSISCIALKVVPTVERITLDLPAGPYIKGAKIQVSGEVWGKCGKPWPFDTWPVIIDLVDKKGLRAQDPYAGGQGEFIIEDGETIIENCSANYDPCTGEPICPVIAHTKQLVDKTIFEADITLPACEEYGLDYTIRARTIEVQDCNADSTIDYVDSFTVDCALMAAEGLEDFAGETGPGGTHILYSPFDGKECYETESHAWLEAIPRTITLSPGTPSCIGPASCPGSPIPFNKPWDFCINVYDKFGNLTTVKDAGGLKVCLVAYDGDKEVAGIFKDAQGNEITHIYIPQGETGICVKFYPKKLGDLTIEGRSIINNNKSVARCEATVNEATQAQLDITAKAVKDVNGTKNVPVAGWPLSAAIWLKDNNIDIGASEDYDVYVSLRSVDDGNDANWAEESPEEFCPPSCATWDTVLNTTFGFDGRYDGQGEIYDETHSSLLCEPPICHPWDKYTHPYCTVKSHFYVYPSASCACKEIYVQAKLVGKTTGNVILTNTVKVGPFADPVDLKRVLNADTWQVLSTPQELVGSGGMDSLLPESSFTDILTYKNYGWSSLAPNEPLDPLFAYYVKTAQRATQASPNCYVAKYTFKRVANPGEDIPPTRTLVQGWNLVGVAMPSEMTLPPAIEIDIPFNCPVPNCDSPNCEGYPCAKLYQPEFLGKMLGTTCEACKKTYNPGGAGLDIIVTPVPDVPPLSVVGFDGDPNKMANLAGFTAADVSQGTLEAWALDPLYLVFNGDGYWVYMTKTQTLAAEVGQSMFDDVLLAEQDQA